MATCGNVDDFCALLGNRTILFVHGGASDEGLVHGGSSDEQFAALSNAVAAQGGRCGGQLWSVSAGLEVTARESRSHLRGHAHLKDGKRHEPFGWTGAGVLLRPDAIVLSGIRSAAYANVQGDLKNHALLLPHVPLLLVGTEVPEKLKPPKDVVVHELGDCASEGLTLLLQADALAARPEAVDRRLCKARLGMRRMLGLVDRTNIQNPDRKDDADPHTRGDQNWWDKVWRDWMWAAMKNPSMWRAVPPQNHTLSKSDKRFVLTSAMREFEPHIAARLPARARLLAQSDRGDEPVVQWVDADGFLRASTPTGAGNTTVTPVLPACNAESADDAFFEDARKDIVAGLHEGLATHLTHCEKIKNPYMHVGEGKKPYFHAGDFDRIGRGEADIQYVSKDGCRFLGLWPFRGQPAVVCRSKEECGLEAGRTVP